MYWYETGVVVIYKISLKSHQCLSFSCYGLLCAVFLQFFLHNVTEPRPQDPDMPAPATDSVEPRPKMSLVPFVSAVRKLRYVHIRLIYVWGIMLSHDDIVSLVSQLRVKCYFLSRRVFHDCTRTSYVDKAVYSGVTFRFVCFSEYETYVV